MSQVPGIVEPPRIQLARTPTPLERLDRTSRHLDIDLWVKRDDLTGTALSGNKVRKLEYLLADLKAQGCTGVVTCGGVNSNHARATAVAAARLGLRAHLLLRGADRVPPSGNLLIDRWVGAQTTFVDQAGWLERNARMKEIAEVEGGYGVIPEGGSNGLGALGYVRCAAELVSDMRRLGVDIRRIVHACGSGGTTAGLALGLAALELDIDVIAVAVMADRKHFDAVIRSIVEDAVVRGWVAETIARRARWTVLDGYVGQGYAKTSPEEMAAHHALARREGVIVDPVYTGKAFLPIARRELRETAGTTVFLHTGGLFELFAYPNEVAALAPEAGRVRP